MCAGVDSKASRMMIGEDSIDCVPGLPCLLSVVVDDIEAGASWSSFLLGTQEGTDMKRERANPAFEMSWNSTLLLLG